MSEKVKISFDGLTYESKYRFLEAGKDDVELKEIGKKYGLDLPSPDIAVFKGLYAYVELENKNKCLLPKEEVEKALTTLRGKAVDIDHLRRNTVGTWLGAELVGDEIISYGTFWKENYSEEYDEFKDMMEKSGVAISFEAWGDREMKDDNSYNLTNIHFAGGALLKDTKPAFAGAGVLEFAKVMDTGMTNKKDIEKARYYTFEMESIWNRIYDIENPITKQKGMWDIQSIDFINNKVVVQDMSEESGTILEVDLTPRVKETTKEIKQITLRDNAKSKENAREGEKVMEEKLSELQTELASLQAKITELEAAAKSKDEEVASLKTKMEESSVEIKAKSDELEAAKAKLAEVEAAKQAEVEAANKKLVEERKSELVDFAKDMTDEQLLDSKEYEIAKLRKEKAELLKANQEGKKIEMTAGSTRDTDLPATLQMQSKIHKNLWK